MLGESAPVRGPGEDSREVEHADPFEWAGRAANGLGLGLSDLLDLDARQRADGSTLLVISPLFLRAYHGAAGPRLGKRVLEGLRVPLRDRGGNGLGVGPLREAEHTPSRLGEPGNAPCRWTQLPSRHS